MKPKTWLSASEFAKELSVSIWTVRRWIYEEKPGLHYRVVGGTRYQFNRQCISAIVKETQNPASND